MTMKKLLENVNRYNKSGKPFTKEELEESGLCEATYEMMANDILYDREESKGDE